MIKGDKIRLIKPMGLFTNIGEICDVIDITSEGVVSFKFGENGCHLGCMSYDEFGKYFELVSQEEIKQKHEWTDWEPIYINSFDLINNSLVLCTVRNNGKNIQIRHKTSDGVIIKGRASCSPSDKFDYAKGLKLAESRLRLHYLKYIIDKMAKSM